jgi:PiT family inorganic phosphate transporter
VGKDLFHLSPITALIALSAEAIVLFLFASRGLYDLLLGLGLPTIPLVPVSSTQVIVGAVVGIGLCKGGKNIRYNILAKVSFAWIAAPVLAALISFTLLFIIQNVFEQKVQQETNYIFDRKSITKIAEDGYDTSALSTVNGRSFTTQRDIYIELKEQNSLTRDEIIGIIGLTEIHHTTVDIGKLKAAGLEARFSENQLRRIEELANKSYRHKWQLLHDLAKEEEFRLYDPPENEIQKNHNRVLQTKLDLLYRTFLIEN